MIRDTINQQIATALKAGEKTKLETLRQLSSAFNYERIAKQHDLSEQEELEVVAREAKKRREAIEVYKNAQEADRAHQEQKELEVLQEFLPAQMNDGELIQLIESVIHESGAQSMAEMGRVIGEVKSKAGSRAEGGRIAEIVKTKLQ